MVAHLIGILPIAIFGYWANYLIPSTNWILLTLHLSITTVLFCLRVPIKWLASIPFLVFGSSLLYNIRSLGVILNDLDGDWRRLVFAYVPPVIYLVISSTALLLMLSKHEAISALVYREAV